MEPGWLDRGPKKNCSENSRIVGSEIGSSSRFPELPGSSFSFFCSEFVNLKKEKRERVSENGVENGFPIWVENDEMNGVWDKKRAKREELRFKRWFRDSFKGWSEAYEPRRGAGNGIPDLQLLIDRALVPIELKVGYTDNDMIYVYEVQPSQVSWHIQFWRAGGVARFVVGIPDGKTWEAIALPEVSFALMEWRKGWKLSDCKPWTAWD